MRITKLVLICLCCLIAAPALMGQAASNAPRPGILGYLDPHTGAFLPVPQATEEAAEPPAVTTVTGTVTLTITVTIKSTGITTVTCSQQESVEDALTSGSPRFLSETNTVAATGTGSTRTCKLSIPYSWGLSTESSDKMLTGYTVSGAASATGALPARTSSNTQLDSRAIPANGATTALTAAVTI